MRTKMKVAIVKRRIGEKRNRRTLLVLFALTAMLFGVAGKAFPKAVAAVESKMVIGSSTTYEQFLAYYYLTYSQLDFYLENDELPYHTYVKDPEGEMKKRLDEWRGATMGASDHLTYSDKEVDFYLLLLYDVAYQNLSEKNLLENFNTAADSVMASTLASLGKGAAEGALTLTPDLNITDENWDEVLNQIVAAETMRDVAKYSGKILKIAKYAGTVEDLFEKLAMIKAFADCSDELISILDDIYAYANDELMREAVRRMKLAATDLLTDEEISAIFGGEVAMNEIAKFALDKLWDATAAYCPLLKSFDVGQKIGKLTSNFLCSTDAIAENWYSMQKVYTFECALEDRLRTYIRYFNNQPTQENAKLLNKAAEMYFATLSVGMEYAEKYAEAVRGEGFFGWLYKSFHADEYQSLMKNLRSIKSHIDQTIYFAQNNTYNFYLDSLEEALAAEGVTIPVYERTPCSITEEELVEQEIITQDILFSLTNQTVDKDTSYSGDKTTYADFFVESGKLNLAGKTLTVYGDFYINNGTVNVNAGELNVRGNLYVDGTLLLSGGHVTIGGELIHSGGEVQIGKGKLEVTGDYRFQSPGTNSAGETVWGVTNGALVMCYDEDQLIIEGGFYASTSKPSTLNLSAGTMTVGGDIVSTFSDGWEALNADGTHKVVLNGTQVQTISLSDYRCGFATLENNNPAGIIVDGYFQTDSLEATADTLNIQSKGMKMRTVNVNVPTVNITGDVTIDGGIVALQKNTLKIAGELIHSGGEVQIGRGKLEVTGDYRFQSPATNSAGETTWGITNGALVMCYEEDQLIVNGGFYASTSKPSTLNLSAGTMTVGGDIVSTFSDGWEALKPDGTHKVVLNGAQIQTISFSDYRCGFATLEVDNDLEIIVDGYFQADSLEATVDTLNIQSQGMKMRTVNVNVPVVTITGDVTIDGGTVSLQKNTMKIDGNLIHSGGELQIGNGTLTVTGDYRIQKQTIDELGEVIWGSANATLNMNHEEGTVIVEDDFVMQSSDWHHNYSGMMLTAGVMKIAGDFYQLDGTEDNNFVPSGSHTVILNGTSPQKVYFESAPSDSFNILDLRQDFTQYTFDPLPCWKTLLNYGEQHSHAYTETVLDATCEHGGYTLYRCESCGDSYSGNATEKLEHSFTEYAYNNDATVFADGTETANCDYGCGKTDTRNKENTKLTAVAQIGDTEYANLAEALAGVSDGGTITLLTNITGEVIISQEVTIVKNGFTVNITAGDGYSVKSEEGVYIVEKLSEKVEVTSSSMVLGNELAMYFYVSKADLEGTDYVAVVTKTYADGRADVTVEIPFSAWEDSGADSKRFRFDGISAKEMGDAIHVYIKNSEGTVLSDIYTDSIQGYVKRGFETGKATGKLATMLVDMLNYGAAAQGIFHYNEEHPANENMAAYQHLATQTVTLQNNQEKGKGFTSMSLVLESNIKLILFFEKAYVTRDMTAVVTFTNHYGEGHELRIPGSAFEDRGSNGWAVVINELVVADGCQLVTCKFLDADGQEVNGVYGIDSMESMCARAVAGGGGTWYEDIMKFSVSAYRYFH